MREKDDQPPSNISEDEDRQNPKVIPVVEEIRHTFDPTWKTPRSVGIRKLKERSNSDENDEISETRDYSTLSKKLRTMKVGKKGKITDHSYLLKHLTPKITKNGSTFQRNGPLRSTEWASKYEQNPEIADSDSEIDDASIKEANEKLKQLEKSEMEIDHQPSTSSNDPEQSQHIPGLIRNQPASLANQQGKTTLGNWK
ncbi:hypothetical protein JTB14_032183 [Gonioctena quinquepunctata]|nr:hypothetical protein JTB14_032183 [Gonioctena quinquepunctata]